MVVILLPEGGDLRRLNRARGRGEGRSFDDVLPRRSLGSVLTLPGTGLRDPCRWSPPDVGADPLVLTLVHAGVVILRRPSTGGGTTAKHDAAVTDGGPSPLSLIHI